MADEVSEQDGSIASAASAIQDILRQTPVEGTPQPDSPQAPEQEPVVAADTSSEPAQAAADVSTAPAVIPEPARQATESPELSQRLQEADRSKQEAEALKSQFINALNTYVPQMEAAIRGEFADIRTYADLQNVAQTDPDRYNRFVIKSGELRQAQQAQAQAQSEQQKTIDDQRRQSFAAEQQKLYKLVPELADPVKGRALADKLQSYALKIGIRPDRLSNYTADEFVALNKSMRFDDLETAKQAAQAKAANAPPVQKPGVAKTTGTKEDKLQTDFERLQKTGRQDAAAAVFRHFIN